MSWHVQNCDLFGWIFFSYIIFTRFGSWVYKPFVKWMPLLTDDDPVCSCNREAHAANLRREQEHRVALVLGKLIDDLLPFIDVPHSAIQSGNFMTLWEYGMGRWLSARLCYCNLALNHQSDFQWKTHILSDHILYKEQWRRNWFYTKLKLKYWIRVKPRYNQCNFQPAAQDTVSQGGVI